MPQIKVIDRQGIEHVVVGQDGWSAMEAIRDAGIDELLALCGGCCSCATCHVYVNDDAIAHLPPMTADENDLLDSSDFRRSGSRLSCQISLSAQTDGMTVTVAPED